MLRLWGFLVLVAALVSFAWTTPRTWIVSEVPTAALFNTHVRDNFDFLGDVHDHSGDAGDGGALGQGHVIAIQSFGAH